MLTEEIVTDETRSLWFKREIVALEPIGVNWQHAVYGALCLCTSVCVRSGPFGFRSKEQSMHVCIRALRSVWVQIRGTVYAHLYAWPQVRLASVRRTVYARLYMCAQVRLVQIQRTNVSCSWKYAGNQVSLCPALLAENSHFACRHL